jgi:hypothetical protein
VSAPQRIQLRRTKGWRKPPGVVVVARPSKWGNPFRPGDRVTPDHPAWGAVAPAHAVWNYRSRPFGWQDFTVADVAQAVEMYRTYVGRTVVSGYSLAQRAVAELAGRDLACWCPLDQPCHADVLLELANAGGGS